MAYFLGHPVHVPRAIESIAPCGISFDVRLLPVGDVNGTNQWHRCHGSADSDTSTFYKTVVTSERLLISLAADVSPTIMFSSMFAALFLAFSPFCFLSIEALDLATAVDQFRPVFVHPDGSLLCGVGPTATILHLARRRPSLLIQVHVPAPHMLVLQFQSTA